MSRFDDIRLGGPGSIETKRKSFLVSIPRMYYGEQHGESAAIEILYSDDSDVPRIIELFKIALAKGAGKGDLQPPSEEQMHAELDEELLGKVGTSPGPGED